MRVLLGSILRFEGPGQTIYGIEAMSLIIEGNETYIRRLRITTNERDALSLRLHLDRILGSADLQPAGLPPSAVVCIRNLRVSTRLPLYFRDSRFATEWKTAIATSLDQLVRRAARPAYEAVPVDARAVVFLERAEMLACLASDWCNGLVLARWWWQGLLRNASAERVVKESWRAAAEYAPSALAHLAKKGKAVEFVRAWSNAESLGLLRDVTDGFALRELLPVVELAKDADRDRRPASRKYSSPPWQKLVPEIDGSELEVGQQLLLSVGLLLRRAPALVRTADFAGEVSDWYEQVSALPVQEFEDPFEFAEDGAADAATPDSPVRAAPAGKVEASRNRWRVSARAPEPRSQPPELTGQESDTESAQVQTPRAHGLAIDGSRQSSLPPDSDFAWQTVATEPVDKIVRSPAPRLERNRISHFDREPNQAEANPNKVEGEMEPAPAAIGADMLAVKDEVETQFGGVFYLINVGLYLNLYGDFTTPAAAGIELNIWDFIALVGHELAGRNDDPIWPFLAGLAGREMDRPPGEGFVPRAEWRVAPEWLADFAAKGSWKWTANDGRLRLAHPEGFLVLDLSLDRNPVRQLQTEIERYATALGHSINPELADEVLLENRPETLAQTVSPQLRRWLGLLMPYVRARLRVALGLKSDESLGAVLCRRHARVQATDTHVDVYFDLADLPLEIRLAGLDRDPGWVPAAGRFVAFHFD